MTAFQPIERNVALQPAPLSPEAAGAPGAALTKLADQAGDAATNYAEAQFRAGQEHDLVQARLAATTQLDGLSDKYRSDADPDTMAQRYGADAAKIGQTVGANLTGRAADQFQESFGLMALSRQSNIKDIAFDRKVSAANADVDALGESSARGAAYAANPAERISAITNFNSSVDGLVSSGMLPAAQGEKKKQAFNERLALFQGKRDSFFNPQQTLKNLNDPGYLPQMDPLARIELMHSTEGEIRTREREAREAQTQKRIEAELAAQDLHEAASSGLPVAQSVIDGAVSTARASGDPRAVAKVTGLLQAVGFASSMRGAAPRDVDAGIAALADKANAQGATPGLAAAYEAALKFKENMNTSLAHDPLDWAARQGVIGLQPLALNGTDQPAAFAQRIKQAQDVSRRYGVRFQPFTQAESQTLKTRLDDPDPNKRLATLQMVVKGLGSNALPVLGKLGAADPAMANAGALVASGPGYEGTARDILTGKHLLTDKANESLRPTAAAQGYAGAPQMMSAYALLPDSRTAVLDGASALFAARASRLGLRGADVANTSQGRNLFKQVLQEASGARFEGDGTQWGGIANYRSNSALVPGNIKADDFEDIVHSFRPADLARASVNGQAPAWEGGEAPDNLIHRSWLISAGNGVYGLSATDPSRGAMHPVLDKSGQPFRFRFGTALVAMQARTGSK